jgi:hypothetical protein
MSYEGYRELKCGCGNIDGVDCNSSDPRSCRKCGGRFVLIRSIDSTNGHDVGSWREVEYRPRFKDYVAISNRRA